MLNLLFRDNGGRKRGVAIRFQHNAFLIRNQNSLFVVFKYHFSDAKGDFEEKMKNMTVVAWI